MSQNLPKSKKSNSTLFIRPVFFVLLFLSVSAVANAQAEKKIALPYKDATGQQLIDLMQKETGFVFSFNDSVALKLKSRFHIEKTPATVNEILHWIYYSLHIGYTQIGNSVVLTLLPQVTKKQPSPPAIVKGRIVDFETSQPLAGATVSLPAANKTVVTDDKGYYAIPAVEEGGYLLAVSYAGYRKNTQPVMVSGGKDLVLDIQMLSAASLDEVVVSSGPPRVKAVTHTTDKELVTEIRTANSVVSGISSEQISKMADRNAAQVIQRTSGVTIRDDRFPVVRGMDVRYNVIYLNDNIAPSTELYNRNFALDLIPSRIIDRILVYKSPAPDIYGDMSGGAIRLYTKDARAVKHFDIEVVASNRVGTSFKPLLTYSGGKYDYIGFDDGTRKLPSGVPAFGDLHKAPLSQQQYVQGFSPLLQYGYKTAWPDLQITMNAYHSIRMGRHRIASLTAINYRYEAQRNDIETQTGNTDAGKDGSNNDKSGNEDQNIENVQVNLLQNFAMKLRDSGQLYFRNFILEDASKSVVVRMGHDNIIQQPGPLRYLTAMRKDNILSFTQRFLYAGHLGGQHYFKKKLHTIRWNLGYSYSHQDIPDQRIIRLQHGTYKIYTDPYILPGGVAGAAEGTGLGWEPYYRGQASITEVDNQPTYGMITRLWLRNTEGVYNASVDYEWHLRSWMRLKAGTFQQWKEREVYRKQFKVNDGQEGFGGYPAGYYSYADWNKVDYKEQDLNRLWSSDYLSDDNTALKVYDNTQTQDSYNATEQLNAGYIALLARPLENKLDFYGGLRIEYDRQKLAAAPGDASGTTPLLVDRPVWSWLPSLNITYRLLDNWILRAAYGRSVNRPEFREISPFGNLDFISNELIAGNPRLISARIDNYDLRMEWYPRSARQDEMINAGGFYKKLNNPIERIRQENSVGDAFTSIGFKNASTATLYGFEAELRKSFGFMPGRFFKNLYIIANGAIIHSEVNVRDSVRLGTYKSDGYSRPLQGQAPYVANVGLFYDNAGTGTKLSVSYNVAGTRIYAAGVYQPVAMGGGIDSSRSIYRGSILELPRHLVDCSITQRIVRSLQIKVSVQNLLNEAVSFVEDNNFNYRYDKEKQVLLYLSDGRPWLNPDSTQKTAYKGDNIFRKYYPNRYVRITLTYSF